MKIAVYHNLAFGGALRVVSEQIRFLAKAHSIDLFTFERFPFGNIYDFDNFESENLPVTESCQNVYLFPAPIHGWPQALTSRYLRPYLKTIDLVKLDKIGSLIARQINSNGYDLVFAHHDRISQAPFFLRHLKVPSIYFLQEPNRSIYDINPGMDSGAAGAPHHGIAHRAKQIALSPYKKTLQHLDAKNTISASLHLSNSKYSKNFIDRSYGIESFVSYLGVDTETFKPVDHHRENQIVVVSTIAPSKAQDFILRGLALISPSYRPRLVLCYKDADMRYLDEVRTIAETAGIETDFVQGASDSEIAYIYNRSLFAVYCPVREPFGLVPLEAMACGIPVLGINEGGVPESILDNQTGILVNRNVLELSNAMERLLSDKSLRDKMGSNSRDYIEKYWTWEESNNSLEHRINTFISSTPQCE